MYRGDGEAATLLFQEYPSYTASTPDYILLLKTGAFFLSLYMLGRKKDLGREVGFRSS